MHNVTVCCAKHIATKYCVLEILVFEFAVGVEVKEQTIFG